MHSWQSIINITTAFATLFLNFIITTKWKTNLIQRIYFIKAIE